jgi:hypothetical protein
VSGLAFSDAGNVLYVRRTSFEQSAVVVDGAEVARLPHLTSARFTGRGADLALQYWADGAHRLRLTGPGRTFAIGRSAAAHVSTGPGGRVLWVGLDSRIRVDGRPHPGGEWTGRVRWSADGARLAIVTRGFGRDRLLADGRVISRGNRIEPLGFDPLGRPIHAVEDARGVSLRVGADEVARLGSVAAESFVQAGGRHALFARDADGNAAMVRDGVVAGVRLRSPRELCSRPDGARLAWIDEAEGGVDVIVDGERVATHEDVVPGTLRFAPDGRLAYVARTRVGGEATYEVAIGDRRFGPFDAVGPAGVVFAPDGRGAAWVARSGAWTLFVDGRALASVDEIPEGSGPAWTADGAVQMLGVRRRRAEGLITQRVLVRVRFAP